VVVSLDVFMFCFVRFMMFRHLMKECTENEVCEDFIDSEVCEKDFSADFLGDAPSDVDKATRRLSGPRGALGRGSPPSVQNTKIFCGFFRTGFSVSDRTRYSGSLL
jgi:hypothetical protein